MKCCVDSVSLDLLYRSSCSCASCATTVLRLGSVQPGPCHVRQQAGQLLPLRGVP